MTRKPPPLNQIYPQKLPETTPDPDRYPIPWSTHPKGDGYFDIKAANGTWYALAYCPTGEDCDTLANKINTLNGTSNDWLEKFELSV